MQDPGTGCRARIQEMWQHHGDVSDFEEEEVLEADDTQHHVKVASVNYGSIHRHVHDIVQLDADVIVVSEGKDNR